MHAMGTLYQLRKTLMEGSSLADDQYGHMLSMEEEERLRCWEEHFDTNDPTREAVITPATDILDMIAEPPSVEEV